MKFSIVKAKFKHFQTQAFILLFRFKSILCLIHNAQAGVLPVFCYQTKVTDAYCLKKSWKTFRPIIKSPNSYPCSYWVRPFEFLTRNYVFCYHSNILMVNQARTYPIQEGWFLWLSLIHVVRPMSEFIKPWLPPRIWNLFPSVTIPSIPAYHSLNI